MAAAKAAAPAPSPDLDGPISVKTAVEYRIV